MGSLYVTIYVVLWVSIVTVVEGSGCHHQCDCGFRWAGDDAFQEKTTLRYEVMGGLTGGFAPLLCAGIGYLVYRKCRQPGGSLPKPGSWRENSWVGGKTTPPGGSDRPRGSTPISLYGETEDSFITGIGINKAESPTSRYTNIHRNLPGNDINQWFKNVNTMKY